MKEQYFINNNQLGNGLGKFAKVVQFQMSNLDEFKKWLIVNGAKIEEIKYRKSALEHAENLIKNGTYDYYHDEENGTPFNELPEDAQAKLYGYCHGSGKWSKWTPERIIERNGWREDEVIWFSLLKDSTYTYQLILKDGDYVAREILGDDRKFYDIGDDIKLPYSTDWEELSLEDFIKETEAY